MADAKGWKGGERKTSTWGGCACLMKNTECGMSRLENIRSGPLHTTPSPLMAEKRPLPEEGAEPESSSSLARTKDDAERSEETAGLDSHAPPSKRGRADDHDEDDTRAATGGGAEDDAAPPAVQEEASMARTDRSPSPTAASAAHAHTSSSSSSSSSSSRIRFATTLPEKFALQFLVPNKCAGTLLGKGGEMVNTLRATSGARITVGPVIVDTDRPVRA